MTEAELPPELSEKLRNLHLSGHITPGGYDTVCRLVGRALLSERAAERKKVLGEAEDCVRTARAAWVIGPGWFASLIVKLRELATTPGPSSTAATLLTAFVGDFEKWLTEGQGYVFPSDYLMHSYRAAFAYVKAIPAAEPPRSAQ